MGFVQDLIDNIADLIIEINCMNLRARHHHRFDRAGAELQYSEQQLMMVLLKVLFGGLDGCSQLIGIERMRVRLFAEHWNLPDQFDH